MINKNLISRLLNREYDILRNNTRLLFGIVIGISIVSILLGFLVFHNYIISLASMFLCFVLTIGLTSFECDEYENFKDNRKTVLKSLYGEELNSEENKK